MMSDNSTVSLLGIRHPEELSLARRLDREELKRNSGASATRKTRPQGLASPGHHMSNNSLEGNVQNSPYRMNPNTPQVFLYSVVD